MPNGKVKVVLGDGGPDSKKALKTLTMNLLCPTNNLSAPRDERLDTVEIYKDDDTFGGTASDGEGLRDPLLELIAREEAVDAEPEVDRSPYARFFSFGDTSVPPSDQRSLEKCDTTKPAGACLVVVKPKRKLGSRNKPSTRATSRALEAFLA